MDKLGIIVADGRRGRFITVEVLDDTSAEGSPRLREHESISNPEGGQPARNRFSDRPSRKPAGAGPLGAGPASDDHRERHQAEDDRRFVRELIEAADRFARSERPKRLVVCAAPRLLGLWRDQLQPNRWNGMPVIELAEDQAGRSLEQIRESLTRRGLLPQPKLPRAGVYRPSGQEPSSR
jgi:protein required for attachment to host cells